MALNKKDFAQNIQDKYRGTNSININLENRAKAFFSSLGLNLQKIPTLHHNDKLPNKIEGSYTKDNLSLRKNPRVSDKKAEAVAMHEIYHHTQKDKGLELENEEATANMIEKAYLNENQKNSQEFNFDLIYAYTIKQFYEHNELDKLVYLFGGDKEIARRLYMRAMGIVINSDTKQNYNQNSLSKNLITKDSSNIKKVSTDNFEVKTKIDKQYSGENITFEPKNIYMQKAKYKIEGLKSWTNKSNRQQKVIRFWFSSYYKDYGFQSDITTEIKSTISSKLNYYRATYTEYLDSTKVTNSIVQEINRINKSINIVPNSYCQYEIKVIIDVLGNGYYIKYIKLLHSKTHKKRALDFKIKKEKEILEAKRKKREKQAKIDAKLEKIYDAKLEKVLDRKLDKEAKKFLEYIRNTYKRIEQSHNNYRNAYDSLGVVGHISAVFAGNFRKPKIDKYWNKALKLCKQEENKESIEVEKWKKEVKNYYKKMKIDYKIPWHVKDDIGDNKGYKALDKWIEGRGTNEIQNWYVKEYILKLDRRLFDAKYEMERGEDAWNQWVKESIKGAYRVIFILKRLKDAGSVASSIVWGKAGTVVYSAIAQTGEQIGNNMVGLQKGFDLWKVGKVTARSLANVIVGGVGKNILSVKLVEQSEKLGVDKLNLVAKYTGEFLGSAAGKEAVTKSINLISNKKNIKNKEELITTITTSSVFKFALKKFITDVVK